MRGFFFNATTFVLLIASRELSGRGRAVGRPAGRRTCDILPSSVLSQVAISNSSFAAADGTETPLLQFVIMTAILTEPPPPVDRCTAPASEENVLLARGSNGGETEGKERTYNMAGGGRTAFTANCGFQNAT